MNSETPATRLGHGILDNYRELKKLICEHAGGPDDCAPLLHVSCGEVIVTQLPDGHPTDWVGPSMIVLAQGRRIEWAAIAVEAFVKAGPIEAMPSLPVRRGTFAAEFKEQPETTVRETLNVYVVGFGQNVLISQGYTYDDSGQPVFDEPTVSIAVLGDMVRRMQEAMR